MSACCNCYVAAISALLVAHSDTFYAVGIYERCENIKDITGLASRRHRRGECWPNHLCS